MSFYYDRQGNPTTVDEFEKIYSGDRHVGLTDIGGITVSTVFLGIDHSFGSGPPLLFETMVFDPAAGPLDEEQVRYSTEEQAAAGHAAMVERVKMEACRAVIRQGGQI